MKNYLRMLFFFTIAIFGYSSLYGADPLCQNVFSNAVSTTSGNLNANGSALLYNTEYNLNKLSVGTITGVTKICQGGTATCIATSRASTMTLPSSPSAGSTSHLTINSGNVQSYSADTSVRSANISGTLNLNGEIYFNVKRNNVMGDFTLNSTGILNINGNVTIYAQNFIFDGIININSGSLTVISNGNITFNANAKTNTNGANDKIVILASGTAAINSSVNAIIYTSGSATINGAGVIHGAITSSSIMLNGTVYFDASAINSALIPGCDKATLHTGEREFLLRNPITTRNIKGNMKVIGNTVLCVKNNSGQCINYTGNSSNAQLNLQYIDVDGIQRTFNNSSQAQLSIPTSATIKWAGLYTQGYLKSVTNTNTINTILQEASYITLPSLGTLASKPEVIDIYPNTSGYTTYGYTYNTYAPISSLIGKKGSEINGWVTGANIKAYEGDDDNSYWWSSGSGLGNFGAWVLVVVYEDTSETLKNISVFDGYKYVAKEDGHNNVTIVPSGFLTPTSGDVKSTISLFVGEGDKNIDGDQLYVNNVAINNTNAFYSTINGFTANPSYSNTQGIDIQNHNIGKDGDTSHPQIIGNGATSASITLTSDQDTYFPSMVAFTTELYEPRVCYAEAYYNADGNETITKANKDDVILVKSWIANMKKDASDGNLETAQKVEITVEHDKENLEYQRESTAIKNIGQTLYEVKTDAPLDDTATYIAETNTSTWRVGVGASGTDGGYLRPNTDNDPENKVYISYKTKLLQSGDITIANIYKVSYENSGMGLRIGDESPVNIGICSDFNTSLVVQAPLGIFNAVNQNFSGSTNSKVSTSSDNALYTQIAGQNFNVSILALESDKTTLKAYTGDVNVTLITTPHYLASETEEAKQIKCNNATSLTSPHTVRFANEDKKIETFNFSTAYPSVAFKMAYTENNATKYICSRDSFAIRPATYSLSTNNNHLIGGKAYTLTAKALKADLNVTTNYNQSITTTSTDKNATIDLNIPTGCALDANSTRMVLSFINGTATHSTFTYNNIGDVNVTIVDNEWTAIDQNDNKDCIENNATTVPNGSGKVGCVIKNTQPFTFSPKKFTNELALQNFNTTFTYLSNDGNMSAKLFLTTTALLEDNTTASNYTADCFAEDINYTIQLNGSTQDKRNRIRYFQKDTTTSKLENNATTARATFSTREGNFTNGIASNLEMLFNFDRNISSPDEPFRVAKNDFNITSVVDTNGTSGSDFNRSTDQNATFYYGRVYSTDYTKSSPIPTTIRYEVYCTQNCGNFNLTQQSPTSIRWYQNPLHVTTDGNVSMFTSATTGTKATSISNSTTSTITSGKDTTHQLSNNNAPYTDRIQMQPSSWLLHNPYNPNASSNDFMVEFIKSGDWAGSGSVDRNASSHKEGAVTNDQNITRSHRKMNW
ncbi:hypothetical protein [Sulfurospirillum barnesii]|uniref:Uncharacterized protein n=1 Tax=Sulfurospirillum barnesii (strain ATCC 700032 / DSM 10660 / SES-3) TaxID=760154 RepID=I3XW91_SULBS|nr:hypothetical protein [Sulfurospirillum barnesii]AFL68215.1 hypothetical protein Sulba_0914 [Sulfurospirillum barnesii SES-3]